MEGRGHVLPGLKPGVEGPKGVGFLRTGFFSTHFESWRKKKTALKDWFGVRKAQKRALRERVFRTREARRLLT